MIIILILFFLGGQDLWAQSGRQKRWKIGMTRFNSTLQYKYETQGKGSESATLIDQKVSKSSSGAVSATNLLLEYIFSGRLGFELDATLSPSVRNFSFKTSEGVKIGDIVETTALGYLYGLNLYSKDHSSPGFKFFLGVQTGALSVTHAFSNGGDRDDDQTDTLYKFKSTQSSAKTVPAQVLKGGVDWILDTVGIRLEVLGLQATHTTSVSLGKTSLLQKQYETVTMSGGFTLGVFAHF